MAGRIAVVPPGLLGSLGIQAQGQNPNDLAGFYQPTIEARDWYLTNRLRLVNLQHDVTGTGTWDPTSPADSASWLVPQGEWWLLYGMYVYSSLTAGTVSAQLSMLAVANAGLLGSVALALTPPFVFSAAAGVQIIRAPIETPVFLPPGSKPVVQVFQYAAGALEVFNTSLVYARLNNG